MHMRTRTARTLSVIASAAAALAMTTVTAGPASASGTPTNLLCRATEYAPVYSVSTNQQIDHVDDGHDFRVSSYRSDAQGDIYYGHGKDGPYGWSDALHYGACRSG